LFRDKSYFMKRFFVLFIFLLINQVLFSQNKHTISGYIRSEDSGEELLGATVLVKELGVGGAANIYGYYSITIPEGTYNLVFSYLGYNAVEKQVELKQSIKLNIEMTPSSTMLQEVEIVGIKEDNNVKSVEMSMVKMEMESIKKIPALMGEIDVLRAIKLLPGVQSGGEGSTGFFVRGGGLDQNLVLIDEAPVYNPSHLLGFFSVFNADAIKDAQLYKGGIPAKYGGRLSSVLDVRMKEGNSKKLAVNGGIGLISSRLTIEAPIIKDKMSFIVSGRRTYLDVFTFLSKNEAVKESRLYFYDLNGKINYKINDKNRFFVSYYSGRDLMGINNSFQINWGNRTITTRWNHLFSDKLFSNLTYINSSFDYSVGIPSGNNAFEWNSKIVNNQIKNEYTYYLNTKNTVSFGFETTFHEFVPAEFIPLEEDSDFGRIALPKKHALDNGLFVSNEMKIGKKWTVQAGLRYSYFMNIAVNNDTVFNYDSNYDVKDTTIYEGKFNPYNAYHGPEPRIGVNYSLNDVSSIKLSYNRMRQYLHLATNSSGGTPIDIWMPSSTNILPQIADQIAGGYFRNFKNNMFETSVEVYYKWMQNQIDFKDFAQLIFNPKLEGEVRTGSAEAYGLELLINKKKGRLTGWVSYTLSKTTRTIDGINNGETYLANQDRRNNIAIVLTYDITDQLNFSTNWVYVTGAPMTVPVGRMEYQGQLVPIYSGRNDGKMPDYHRMDVSLTYDFVKHKKIEHSLNLSVYNVYRRKNPYAINFVRSDENPNRLDAKMTYLFDIVPAITYNFKF
jgi:hypothetical protein